MSNYQFPPSSPLLDGYNHESDPFVIHEKGKQQTLNDDTRGRYPTPNPSSATGRSSSPFREDLHPPVQHIQTQSLFQSHHPLKSSISVDIDSKRQQKSKLKSVKFSLNEVADSKSQTNTKVTKIRKVRINSDFNILDPDAKVLRVPLNADGKLVLVGRSSKSCDYYFNSNDRTISRTHLSVSFSNGKVTIECLGFSGFGMRVPRSCLVYGTDKENDYILMEANGIQQPLSNYDLLQLGLKVTPRTINLDNNHTEFFVNRSERVTLPAIDNIFIQVRDEVMLLNPRDDEEDVTEDEMPEIILEKVEKPQKAAVEDIPLAVQPSNPAVEIESVPHPEAQKDKEPKQELPFEAPSPFITSTPIRSSIFSTPIKSSIFSTPLAPLKLNLRANSEEPTPSYSLLGESEFNVQILSDNEPDVSMSPMKERRPLSDITNSTNNITKVSGKESDLNELPKPKKRKVNPVHTTVIDQSCIESVTNISEINNVLLNHLAFSRLSSTPASFLNTISALTSDLTLKQMRVILHNLKAVGVIYREGKDAAGKQLEEEYYYNPEDDDDSERPKLVASIKGHGGLRSCRRTHKQYYWKKPAPKKK